jgi:pantoate--beta-alanine ligase
MELETISGLPVARTAGQLRAWTRQQRGKGVSLGLVPTMGALHEGHASLVTLARTRVEAVILTIFVNPLQFGPREDFAAYPRQLQADCAKAAQAGATLVFAPDQTSMYPPGFQTHVEVEQLTQGLCGASRPGHFRGVTTVVCKLLNLAMADVAVFGEKDWQQLQAIRRMALDLDHPTEVVGAPIVREAGGLAMSSRNAYLSEDERTRAQAIHRALQRLQAQVQAGILETVPLLAEVEASIVAAGGRMDYAAITDPYGLEPLERVDRPARALVAAWFGPARLLDNLSILP